ncbi:MAG: NUDIX hydrolase [Nitrososphaerota archaeon]|nr:NUDIX hydrolase [Nitrososphaerota archaeon]
MTKFGFIGPTARHDVPGGGFCISVFAVIRKGESVLLVRPKAHEKWQEEWAPNWRVYEPEMLEREMRAWRLPSAYVKEGEAPEGALSRVMREQLGISRYKVAASSLENFYDPSRRFPGQMHWDYCFVFEVSTEEDVKKQPWLDAAEYVAARGAEFGSAQEDLAKRVGLL